MINTFQIYNFTILELIASHISLLYSSKNP